MWQEGAVRDPLALKSIVRLASFGCSECAGWPGAMCSQGAFLAIICAGLATVHRIKQRAGGSPKEEA